jgi:membrane fusion protein (multidrug efflux system)
MSKSVISRFVAAGCFLLLSCWTFPAAHAATDGQKDVAAPDVKVVEIQPQSTQLSLEIVGEIRAYREVDLRARVTGNLVDILFKPGQRVAKGDTLFEIDPGPYQTALANAKAGLAQASASLVRVQQDVERYKPLLPDNAIPRQVYDQAVAQAAQEEAVVASQNAVVERAQLDLDYTRVQSPLDGRIGLQQVEIGALITAGQTILATVSTLDPVVVYFSVSENEYLDYMRRMQAEKKGEQGKDPEIPIELVLSDGTVYSERGRIDYSDPSVNATTGTLTLRAVFANPSELLRAGMNCRVRVFYDQLDNAILVPQKAVTETLGQYFVTVVGDGNIAQMQNVKLAQRMGEMWLVTEGLSGGERVVVEGVQKARPGMVVNPVTVDVQSSGK